MELKSIILCLATVLLLFTSLIYGVKFLKGRNYLLGVEWLVVAFSSSNLLVHLVTGAQFPYEVMVLCDAFSRAFGIPVIAVLGLMAVTHRYAPSKRADIAIFVCGLAVTAIVVWADFMAKLQPYFYFFMWTAFSLYLAYFAYRLVRVEEKLHAFGVILTLICGQAIACMEEFWKIPGDDGQSIFLSLALTSWAYMGVQLYYAYQVLERAQLGRTGNPSERNELVKQVKKDLREQYR